MMSKEDLLIEAKTYYYKPEILEKVYQLLSALKQFVSVPYLRDRLVLKGGTALNLFCFENLPRLSVDIDLNYIGQIDRSQMLQERPIINDAIHQIFQQNQFQLDRNPSHHAGGKMVWRYPSILGQRGNLEIDINYMYRQPLWPITWVTPKFYFEKSTKIPVLDIHELAAGKLTALFSRQASRDLFDAHHLLNYCKLTSKKLRLAFVVYLAMTDIEISNLKPDTINYHNAEIANRLLPVLCQKDLPRKSPSIKAWANKLLNELRDALSTILPLKTQEIEFIKTIQTSGEIKAELITNDQTLADKIYLHPAIQWKIIKSLKHV